MFLQLKTNSTINLYVLGRFVMQDLKKHDKLWGHIYIFLKFAKVIIIRTI